MKKKVTIYKMSADSIDVLDEIKVEVDYVEAYETPSPDRFTAPVMNEPIITSITYEGRIITNLLPMFSDEELIANHTLETEMSLTSIKELSQ